MTVALGEVRPRGALPLAHRAIAAALRNGLVTPADIHRFGVAVRDVSQSNAVALIELGNGSGVLAKSTQDPSKPGQGSAKQELDLYRLAAAEPSLQELVPEVFDATGRDGLLLIEGLVGYRPLHLAFGSFDPLDPELARAVGARLGAWHNAAVSLRHRLAPADPWIFSLGSSEQLEVLDETPYRDVVATLLRTDSIMEAIRRCRSEWSDRTIIHGDMRFANILVQPQSTAVRFIDWEMSGSGDPRWDVAGVVQEYLSFDESISAEVATLSGSRAEAGIGAFLRAYQGATGDDDVSESLATVVACRLALRAIQYGGWRHEAPEQLERHVELAQSAASGRFTLAPTDAS